MHIFKPFSFIPKKRIEKQATEILQQMANSPKYQLKFPIDASRVAEFLGLDVVWDTIPNDEQGIIAANFSLDQLIEINELIPELREVLGNLPLPMKSVIGFYILIKM